MALSKAVASDRETVVSGQKRRVHRAQGGAMRKEYFGTEHYVAVKTATHKARLATRRRRQGTERTATLVAGS